MVQLLDAVQLLGADGGRSVYSYLLYRYFYALWFLRAAPSVVSAPSAVNVAACVVPGAFGGALSERISEDTKKSPVPKNRGSLVRPKGFEPPTF